MALKNILGHMFHFFTSDKNIKHNFQLAALTLSVLMNIYTKTVFTSQMGPAMVQASVKKDDDTSKALSLLELKEAFSHFKIRSENDLAFLYSSLQDIGACRKKGDFERALKRVNEAKELVSLLQEELRKFKALVSLDEKYAQVLCDVVVQLNMLSDHLQNISQALVSEMNISLKVT